MSLFLIEVYDVIAGKNNIEETIQMNIHNIVSAQLVQRKKIGLSLYWAQYPDYPIIWFRPL